MSFEAGFAQVDVTPAVGTRMGGFGGRVHGAVGIHDPLLAKAFALSDGSGRALIITCDILSFPHDFVAEICAQIGDRCGLAPEQVLINNSHTHSGPLMRGVNGLGEADETYAANLCQQLGGLAQMAVADMAPVVITSHRGPLQVGINRRERTADGSTRLGRNPELIVDRHVDVLRFADADGMLRAVWFSHATHGVVLGGSNYQFSADWMGYAQRQLQKVYPAAVIAFAQGCCGNINSDPVGGTFEHARRLGTRAAGGVMMALESAGVELDGCVASGRVSAAIPQQAPPPLAEAEQALQDSLARHEQATRAADAVQIHITKGMVGWARWLRDMAANPPDAPALRFDISAVAIGQHAIVGLAGEVFFEYAVNIAERSPFDRTTVLGTTNGCIAYLPTAVEIPWGGYEIDSSMRYYLQLKLKPECEPVVLDAAARLLTELRG